MGNQKTKQTTRIEVFLKESFRYLNLELSKKEITAFNLKLADAENYFFTKFTFIFFYNSTLFTENITTLYENFNRKVECFSKDITQRVFSLLIQFDDESDIILFGGKIDFESLFVIIFEKLEIQIVTSFDLTSCRIPYIADLIGQLYENASLYKFNRQYDCIYCLLPNTDYFIKNSSSLTYASNRKQGIFSKDNEELFSLLLLKRYRKKFLQTRKEDPLAHAYYEHIIEKISAMSCFVFTYVNNLIEEDNVTALLGLLFLIIQNCERVVFCVLINKKYDLPSVEAFVIIMERIVSLCQKEPKLKEVSIKLCLISNFFDLSQNYFKESVRIIRSKMSQSAIQGLKLSFEISQITSEKSSLRKYASQKYTCAPVISTAKLSDPSIVFFVIKKSYNALYRHKNGSEIIQKVLSYFDFCILNNLREKRHTSRGTISKEDFRKNFVLKEHFLF